VTEYSYLDLKSGIVSQAPGSAYLEMENSKVIACVYGPKQSLSDYYSPKGKVVCEFKLATFSQKGKRRAWLPVCISVIYLFCVSFDIRLYCLTSHHLITCEI
jgi:ribonuclease PH